MCSMIDNEDNGSVTHVDRASPFVSKYHSVDPNTITNYLTRKGIEYKVCAL